MPRTAIPAGPARAPKGVAKEHIPLTLPQQTQQQFLRYARQENRSAAAFARLMAMRGLAAYQQNRNVLLEVKVEGAISRQQIRLGLMPDEFAAVESGAEFEQRTRVQFSRLLTLAGLAEYEAEMASKASN